MVNAAESKAWMILALVGVAACGSSSAMQAADAGNDSALDAANESAADAGNDSAPDAGSDQATTTIPVCTSQGLASPAMSAADFCAIFLNGCSDVSGFTIPTGYTTMAMCEASYAALTEDLRMCRSYHLCTAVSPDNMGTTMAHCLHATGTGDCIAH
ncbi:MAG TPA: hypothetical protein VIF57_13945 [Polyangia bacterium]|jgi:hypothetical protein